MEFICYKLQKSQSSNFKYLAVAARPWGTRWRTHACRVMQQCHCRRIALWSRYRWGIILFRCKSQSLLWIVVQSVAWRRSNRNMKWQIPRYCTVPKLGNKKKLFFFFHCFGSEKHGAIRRRIEKRLIGHCEEASCKIDYSMLLLVRLFYPSNWKFSKVT